MNLRRHKFGELCLWISFGRQKFGEMLPTSFFYTNSYRRFNPYSLEMRYQWLQQDNKSSKEYLSAESYSKTIIIPRLDIRGK